MLSKESFAKQTSSREKIQVVGSRYIKLLLPDFLFLFIMATSVTSTAAALASPYSHTGVKKKKLKQSKFEDDEGEGEDEVESSLLPPLQTKQKEGEAIVTPKKKMCNAFLQC